MVYPLTTTISADSLAKLLGLQATGAALQFSSVGQLNACAQGCLAFARTWPETPTKGVVYIAPPFEGDLDNIAHIASSNPRRDFIKALLWLETSKLIAKSDVPSDIHPTAEIGANVVIEPNCVISEGVIIEPNVVIMRGTRIGARSRIRANATLGSSGFGFERDEDGSVLQFVHLGGVIIGSDAEIGANTCICRGTLGDTIVQDGAKIDNLVHISHNVIVGARAFVIAGAEVSGGCQIGEDSWIGPNVCIREKVHIGARALVGIGSTVIRSVPADEIHAGNPARFIKKVS